MTEGVGTCKKHGQFVLTEGCLKCLAEKKGDNIKGRLFLHEEPDGTVVGDLTMNPEPAPGTEEVQTVTALIRIKPDLDVSVRQIYSEAVRLLDFATCRTIKTADDLKDATNDQVIIGNFKKDIEEKRKAYTGPINDHLKAVNQAFQEFTAPLLQADQLNRANMTNYRLAREAIIAEQERINRLRIEAAQAEMELKGELTESVQVIEVQAPVAKSVRTDMGTTTTVDHWKAEVVDFALLPDEYKLPNQQMLNAVARTYKNIRTIPGVRIYNDPDIRTTARRE